VLAIVCVCLKGPISRLCMCVLHGQGKRVLLLAHLPKVGGWVCICVCVFEGFHQLFVCVCVCVCVCV